MSFALLSSRSRILPRTYFAIRRKRARRSGGQRSFRSLPESCYIRIRRYTARVPSSKNRRVGVIQRLAIADAFRCFFAEGEIGGTLCMRSHISVHRGTTKFSSNSFVFKNEIEKEGLPRDTSPALGAGAL